MNSVANPLPSIAPQPVFAILDRAVARFSGRSAIDFLGRSYTYGEIGGLVARAARGFQDMGVVKGVRVGLCLPNTPYFVICYYAVLKAGGIVVNFNPLYVERELKHQIEDSGTSIMVTLDVASIYPKVAAMLEQTCLERVVVCSLGSGDKAEVADDPRHVPFARLVGNDGDPRPVEIVPRTDLAVLQYTGGTTGVPKGAMLTHANLTANIEQLRRWVPGVMEGQERLLCVLPLFHVFAMTVAMNYGVSIGCEVILVPRFDVEDVLKLITHKRPSLLPGVPTIYTAITNALAGGTRDLSSLRYCISGGAPLPVEVRARFEELSGCRLVEGYGLSEASPLVTCNPVAGEIRQASAGLAVDETIVEVRSPTDPTQVLGVGERGEICIRGPQVMAGYWQRPDDTAEAFVDGALRTGDVGYLDESGYLFLVDRIKDVILCGGYNVYPRVIEEALYQHPAVAEAMVIGIRDAYRGQVPKAFVRLREGMTVDPEQIMDFLADRISCIEMPKSVEIRACLPKTPIGKLSKRALVAEETVRDAGQARRNATS